MEVEALAVAIAGGPRLDVAGAQEFRLAGAEAAAVPTFHQALAKDLLADALNDEALSFGRVRQVARFRLKCLRALIAEEAGRE